MLALLGKEQIFLSSQRQVYEELNYTQVRVVSVYHAGQNQLCTVGYTDPLYRFIQQNISGTDRTLSSKIVLVNWRTSQYKFRPIHPYLYVVLSQPVAKVKKTQLLLSINILFTGTKRHGLLKTWIAKVEELEWPSHRPDFKYTEHLMEWCGEGETCFSHF